MPRTDRLSIPVASAEEIGAVVAGDQEALRSLLGTAVPVPLVAPPETGDVLEYFRETLLNDHSIGPWFFRWIVDHQSNQLVGSAGFAGHPDADGVVLIGYSVYPEFEGRGYASEAARALVEWAFLDERVTAVRATIFPTNVGSRKVATRAGLAFQRVVETDEDGIVELWEIVKSATEPRGVTATDLQ